MHSRGVPFNVSDLQGSVRLADGDSGPFVAGDWFQLAKVGTFFSPVYGKITISPQDLMTMFTNFKTKTPLAPTQLPIDYDHLSDEPQKPEDGKAAGWVQDLQVRDDGTMWCQPLWTRRAAEMITNGEYRFVSPFFLTDYLDKASGKKIGPTLKAVAITNRPFLEGMQPIPPPAVAAREYGAHALALSERQTAVPVHSSIFPGGRTYRITQQGECDSRDALGAPTARLS